MVTSSKVQNQANPITTTITTPIKLNFRNNEKKKKNFGITNIFFTKDAKLIKQYQELKANFDKNDMGYVGNDDTQNCKEREQLMIATNSNKEIIAGAKIRIFSGKNGSGFDKYLDESLKNCQYCEISSLLVRDKFQDSSLSARILSLISSYCIKEGIKYILGTFDISRAKKYSILAENLGFNPQIIYDQTKSTVKLENKIGVVPIVIIL